MVPNHENAPSHEGMRRSATVHVRGGGKTKNWRIGGRAVINYKKSKRLLAVGLNKPWADTFSKLMSGLSEDQRHYMRVFLEGRVWDEDRIEPSPFNVGTEYIVGKDGILKLRPVKKEEKPVKSAFIWFDFGGSLYCRYGEEKAIFRVTVAEPKQFLRPSLMSILVSDDNIVSPTFEKEWHYSTDRLGAFPGSYAVGNNCPFDGFICQVGNEKVNIDGIARLRGMYVKTLSMCSVREAAIVEDEVKAIGKELLHLDKVTHQLLTNCRRKRA